MCNQPAYRTKLKLTKTLRSKATAILSDIEALSSKALLVGLDRLSTLLLPIHQYAFVADLVSGQGGDREDKGNDVCSTNTDLMKKLGLFHFKYIKYGLDPELETESCYADQVSDDAFHTSQGWLSRHVFESVPQHRLLSREHLIRQALIEC